MNKKSLTTTSLPPIETPWQNLINATRNTALSQAKLEIFSYKSKTISLQELTGTALLRLHSLRSSEKLNDALSKCEFVLPEKVNQSLGQDPAIICMAPGNWLLFSEYLKPLRLSGQLESALEGDDTTVLDLSASSTTFRLGGEGMKWLLCKVCGLDIFENFNAQAQAARTRIQQAAVSLHYHQPGSKSDEFTLDLIVERSIASYLWHILVDAIPHAEELHDLYG